MIGWLLSAQPKMADARQLDLSWGIPFYRRLIYESCQHREKTCVTLFL